MRGVFQKRFVVCVLALACAVACDNDAIPAAQTTGAAVIGPEGGTVTSADGKIELVVPPGALDTELDMTLVATSFLPPAPLILAAFDFGPDGTEFQIPATLTFTYGEGDIPPGFTADQLRLAAAVNGRWVVLQVTHDPATRTISATVTHFSVYAAGVFPDNEPPTLLFLEPAQDLVVSHGGMVPIEYADDDPDDGAATWLFADEDGDPDTIDDTILLAAARPEQNGTSQQVVWPAADMETPPGIYRLFGVCWDGTNSPLIEEAPGAVILYENVAFARRGGGTLDDRGTATATYADGSCVVAGSFRGTATFESGAPLLPDPTLTEVSEQGDLFLVRYDAAGRLLWVTQAWAQYAEIPEEEPWALAQPRVFPTAIASLLDGSCLVAGVYNGVAVFGAGEQNETELADGALGLFLARYSASGGLVWAKYAKLTGPLLQATQVRLAALPDGSCVVAGKYVDEAVFGPGEANETTLRHTPDTYANNEEAYLARYNADGTLAWARHLAAPAIQEPVGHGAPAIAGLAALRDSSFLATGQSLVDLVFGPGEANQTELASGAFLAHFESDGTLAWAQRPGDVVPLGVATFRDGSSVLCGAFTGVQVFGPTGTPTHTVLTSAGGLDGFVARYDPDGILEWDRRLGGELEDALRCHGRGHESHDRLLGGHPRVSCGRGHVPRAFRN
jgi:hypothetical protein